MAKSRELWLPANAAIEEAYKKDNGEDGVLVGSQFEVGPRSEIRTPNRGAGPNKEFADRLLSELRRKNQLKPDIIDFKSRAIYEIKPIASFEEYKKIIVARHRLLYEIAQDTRDEYNNDKRARGGAFATEPDWTASNARWKPPRSMPLPGDVQNTAICTALTDYGYSIMPGLIIYQLWRRVKKEKDKEDAIALQLDDWDTTYQELIPSMTELGTKIGGYDPAEPEFILIVPQRFHNEFRRSRKIPGRPVSSVKRDIMDRAADRSIPPFFDRRKPIALYRDLPGQTVSNMATNLTNPEFWMYAAIAGAIIVLIGGGLLLLAPEAAAAGAAGEAAGTVVSLAARQLAKEAAVETLKKAAGVVIVFGAIRSAKAAQFEFTGIDAMRILPLSQVAPFKCTWAALSSGLCISDPPESVPSKMSDVKAGDTVMFDSQPCYVVATLRATSGSKACAAGK